MRFKLSYTLLFVFLFLKGESQNFYRSYGNTDDEVGKSVVETKDSSFFIFGTTSSFMDGSSNFYLMNIDSAGVFQWSKTYGGTGIEQGNSIILKPNGHYHLTGYSNSFGNGYNVLTVEIDSLGNEIWQKSFGGDDWDFAYGSTALTNGDVLITGSTFSFGNGNQDGFLWLTDNNGDSVWMKTLGGAGEDILRKTILTSTGELVSVGTYSHPNGDKDIYLIKSQLDGDTIWTKKYGTTSNDEGFSLLEGKNGKYILAGYTEGLGSGGKEGYYFEVDTSGMMTWVQTYGGAGDDIFNAITPKPNESRFFAAWESQSYGNGGCEFVVNILFQNGGWNSAAQTYGTLMNEKPYDVIYTSRKKILIVGSTDSPYGNLNVMAVLSDTLLPTQSTLTNFMDMTSVSETETFSPMKIFPNPATDRISLFSEKEITHVTIFDLSGKMMSEFNTRFSDLDVSGLNSAVYLLKTEFINGEMAFHRLVITRQ